MVGAGQARRVGIEHPVGGVVVEYRPALFADPAFLLLVERVRIGNDVRLHARALSLLLASWNVTRYGQPVPITEEAILGMPLALTTAIVRAIADDGERLRAHRR